MSRGGYLTSMTGAVLALVFSMLMLLTSFLWSLGGDLSRFFEERGDRVGSMWELLGKYHDAAQFLETDLSTYVDDYKVVLAETTSEDLEKLADKYDSEAFADMAAIVDKWEGLKLRLYIGMVMSTLASVAALAAAQVARVRLKAGAVTILVCSILTLGFGVLGGSALPMALASLLMLIGSLVLLKKPDGAPANEAGRVREVL